MGCYDFKDFDPIKVTTTHDTDISEWHLLQLVEKLMPVFIKKGSGGLRRKEYPFSESGPSAVAIVLNPVTLLHLWNSRVWPI